MGDVDAHRGHLRGGERMVAYAASELVAGGHRVRVPVYFTMEYVVVPLSAWHRWPKFAAVPFAENMAAMMVFGLIIAFFASRVRS
jgi:hypothetical protein